VDVRIKTFAAEAERRFAFLLDEHGFAGPEVDRNDGEYPLRIRVRYPGPGRTVDVAFVSAYMGEEYVATTLRPAGGDAIEIGTNTAHTGHQLRRALDRQAAALRAALERR
jgi:hypothetical protein